MNQNKSLSKIVQVALFGISYQIGCGVFLLPSPLSKCGYSSLFVLLFLGVLCIMLARVYSETGKNSQEIICEAFGKKISNIAFFLYWIGYSFAMVVMFKELAGYLKYDAITSISIQVVVCLTFITINLFSFKYSMIIDIFITILKFTPFIGLLIGYFATESVPIIGVETVKASLFVRCFFCYQGLELGIIAAKNLNATTQERKIGMTCGILSVVAFYILGIFFCFSICGVEALYCNTAPYISVFQYGLSGFFSDSVIVVIIRSIIVICLLASINTYTIGNGYMAYEGAMADILPKFFTKRNKNNVPHVGIAVTALSILAIVLLSYNPNIYAGTMQFVDITGCFFLLMYAMCLFSYGKVYLKGGKKVIYYVIAFIFIAMFVYGFCSTITG